jgi:carbon-monoxide dehydrogenase small subunit
MTEQKSIKLKVNGKTYSAKVRVYDTLLRVLREEIGLTGSKVGCDFGGCGACTVLVEGRPVYSCMFPVHYCVNKEIITIEGLSEKFVKAQRLQSEFMKNGGFQCGYCTPGILVSSTYLLEKNPQASLDDIKEALSGNICRCTGYGGVIRSVLAAVEPKSNKGGDGP